MDFKIDFYTCSELYFWNTEFTLAHVCMQKPPVNFKSHPGQWADGLATRTEHFFFLTGTEKVAWCSCDREATNGEQKSFSSIRVEKCTFFSACKWWERLLCTLWLRVVTIEIHCTYNPDLKGKHAWQQPTGEGMYQKYSHHQRSESHAVGCRRKLKPRQA
jgi:hypothetical protein